MSEATRLNRAKYAAAVLMVFIRDTAMEGGMPPRRKQIEIDAAINSLGLDPSELSFSEKQRTFQDLAELRVIHGDGEQWFLSPEIADWLRIPEGPADEVLDRQPRASGESSEDDS